MNTGIQEYSQTEAALTVLGLKYGGVLFDVGTSSGLAEAKAARADIKGYRVELEKKRKELKAPALDRCKLIDDEAKRITAALTALEDPIDSAIKAEEARKETAKLAKEEAERVRAAIIAGKIADITSYAFAALGRPALKISDMIKSVEAMEIDSSFGDRFGEASLAKADTLTSLRQAFDAQVAADHREDAIRAEREQLAREKRQHEEAVAAENAARELAVEAERKAAVQEAEKLRRMAAEIKAAQAKLDDEVRRADLAKVEAERERARTLALEEAKAKAGAAEEAKRVADKAKAEREEEVEKQIRRDTASQAPVSVFTSPLIEAARGITQFGNAVASVKMGQAPRQNPGLNAILFTLSERYEVSTEVAAGWLRELINEKAA